MSQLRAYLEIAYFIAGIAAAIAAIRGLAQLKLLKVDIETRNIRAAREKAIEASNRYLIETVRADAALFDEYKQKGIKTAYEGPIGDMTFKSLPASWYKNSGKFRFESDKVLPFLNSLQMVSSAFTSGVADSETGFKIIGRTFCASVQMRYDLICMCRHIEGAEHDYFDSIRTLYLAWSSKLTAAELASARKKIENQISNLSITTCESINPKT